MNEIRLNSEQFKALQEFQKTCRWLFSRVNEWIEKHSIGEHDGVAFYLGMHTLDKYADQYLNLLDGKEEAMNQADKRAIRFRIADYKKNLLENYNNAVILLNGDLERQLDEGREKELASVLINRVQALINDVDFIYWLVNGKRYFVTDEPGKGVDNENKND